MGAGRGVPAALRGPPPAARAAPRAVRRPGSGGDGAAHRPRGGARGRCPGGGLLLVPWQAGLRGGADPGRAGFGGGAGARGGPHVGQSAPAPRAARPAGGPARDRRGQAGAHRRGGLRRAGGPPLARALRPSELPARGGPAPPIDLRPHALRARAGGGGSDARDRDGPPAPGGARPAGPAPGGDRSRSRAPAPRARDRLRRGDPLRAASGVEGTEPSGLPRLCRGAGAPVGRPPGRVRPSVRAVGGARVGRIPAGRGLRHRAPGQVPLVAGGDWRAPRPLRRGGGARAHLPPGQPGRGPAPDGGLPQRVE